MEVEIKGKKITFSLTSNMTLLNRDMAHYFANLDEACVILASIDGPKEIHNKNRIYENGEGSFDNAIRGLQYAFEEYSKVGKSDLIHFSTVVSGPEYEEILEGIKEFIEETPWIPNNIVVNASHASRYNGPTKYTGPNSDEEREYFAPGETYADPILKWSCKQQDINRDTRFTSNYEEKVFIRIHNRPIFDKPMQNYTMNGCCVPFSRRTYVTTEGKFQICEKVGDAPFCGDVFQGLQIDKIKEYYVDGFVKEAVNYCSECWIINICNECYLNCFNNWEIDFEFRHLPCRYNRFSVQQDLISYHNILEENPERLEYLNDVVVI